MLSAREVVMPERDDELLARCRAGELDAFGQLYARYEGMVYRYAYRLLDHAEDATDVKQETFLRAYRTLGSFRGQAAIHTWLLRICGNLCRDRLKSWERRRISSFDGEEGRSIRDGLAADAQTADPAQIVERAEAAEIALRALRGLPPRQRELIVLRDMEGLSCAETAAIVGGTAASVKVRVFRARKQLKERVCALLKAEEV